VQGLLVGWLEERATRRRATRPMSQRGWLAGSAISPWLASSLCLAGAEPAEPYTNSVFFLHHTCCLCSGHSKHHYIKWSDTHGGRRLLRAHPHWMSTYRCGEPARAFPQEPSYLLPHEFPHQSLLLLALLSLLPILHRGLGLPARAAHPGPRSTTGVHIRLLQWTQQEDQSVS
jgi:hypothetical protein